MSMLLLEGAIGSLSPKPWSNQSKTVMTRASGIVCVPKIFESSFRSTSPRDRVATEPSHA